MSQPATDGGERRNEDARSKEYYYVSDAVKDFDQRLTTVKGWGVTLGLAALAWGFQQQHYGLFLVGAAGGLAFWLIEGLLKRYQMRYYVRLRDLEVDAYEVLQLDGYGKGDPAEQRLRPTPLIDWSWHEAPAALEGTDTASVRAPPHRYGEGDRFYRFTWLGPQVFLPHAITVTLGLVLFALGVAGKLGEGMKL